MHLLARRTISDYSPVIPAQRGRERRMLILIFTLGVIVGGAVATVGWALWANSAMRGGL